MFWIGHLFVGCKIWMAAIFPTPFIIFPVPLFVDIWRNAEHLLLIWMMLVVCMLYAVYHCLDQKLSVKRSDCSVFHFLLSEEDEWRFMTYCAVCAPGYPWSSSGTSAAAPPSPRSLTPWSPCGWWSCSRSPLWRWTEWETRWWTCPWGRCCPTLWTWSRGTSGSPPWRGRWCWRGRQWRQPSWKSLRYVFIWHHWALLYYYRVYFSTSYHCEGLLSTEVSKPRPVCARECWAGCGPWCGDFTEGSAAFCGDHTCPGTIRQNNCWRGKSTQRALLLSGELKHRIWKYIQEITCLVNI